MLFKAHLDDLDRNSKKLLISGNPYIPSTKHTYTSRMRTFQGH